MGSEISAPVIRFGSAAEADRRIAGVAAAARAARAFIEAGNDRIRLRIPDRPLSPRTLDDLERLRGNAAVVVEEGAGEGVAPDLPSSWEVVRATGKPGDGPVSRWLNRPISQRITWLVLKIPGALPIHVTAANILLALVMAALLLFGGDTGLILGGIAFHAASVLDGVDGEMARASFRTSASGAALDSVVDMATNLVFIAAVTVHLALRDRDMIGWVGGWALLLGLVGSLLIARRVRASGAPLGFDMFKRAGRIRGVVDLIYSVVQTLSSRDCFAFLFMVLIIVGLERTALWLLSSITTLWFCYVLASLAAFPRLFRGAA